MSKVRMCAMIVVAALASAAANGAWAADKGKTVDFTVRSEPATAAPDAGRLFRWDASKGRFGITVNLQQPSERPSTLNDVQAGAFFRITPSLRVGGSVALGDQELTPRANAARPADAPKVRLETNFKF